jgi:hypothetical protein
METTEANPSIKKEDEDSSSSRKEAKNSSYSSSTDSSSSSALSSTSMFETKSEVDNKQQGQQNLHPVMQSLSSSSHQPSLQSVPQMCPSLDYSSQLPNPNFHPSAVNYGPSSYHRLPPSRGQQVYDDLYVDSVPQQQPYQQQQMRYYQHAVPQRSSPSQHGIAHVQRQLVIPPSAPSLAPLQSSAPPSLMNEHAVSSSSHHAARHGPSSATISYGIAKLLWDFARVPKDTYHITMWLQQAFSLCSQTGLPMSEWGMLLRYLISPILARINKVNPTWHDIVLGAYCEVNPDLALELAIQRIRSPLELFKEIIKATRQHSESHEDAVAYCSSIRTMRTIVDITDNDMNVAPALTSSISDLIIENSIVPRRLLHQNMKDIVTRQQANAAPLTEAQRHTWLLQKIESTALKIECRLDAQVQQQRKQQQDYASVSESSTTLGRMAPYRMPPSSARAPMMINHIEQAAPVPLSYGYQQQYQPQAAPVPLSSDHQPQYQQQVAPTTLQAGYPSQSSGPSAQSHDTLIAVVQQLSRSVQALQQQRQPQQLNTRGPRRRFNGNRQQVSLPANFVPCPNHPNSGRPIHHQEKDCRLKQAAVAQSTQQSAPTGQPTISRPKGEAPQ